jgi:methionyl-tRNA synthetase
MYVWFDAPIGYISATKELTNDWEKYWKDEETKMVHFIGKDNIVFHCIIFPSMLKDEGSYILPDNVPANEFLNLEGDKISTSRNWAVWLHEYLDEFPGKEDVLRYVLCSNAPETKDNDFTWKDFQSRNNNELVAILGNFVNRAIILTQNYFDGKVPATGELTSFDEEVLSEIYNLKENVENSLENYRFREALKEAMNLARLGNKYLADTEPWKIIKEDKTRVGTILNLSLQITANLGILLAPFLPKTVQKLNGFIHFSAGKWEDIGKKDLLPVGHTLNESALLFAKIDDNVIQAQIDKLLNAKAKADSIHSEHTPQKEAINFDDFTKLDIRTGTILEAEKVAKTKKLIKLVIDTGLDKRTIVSGIAEFFEPEKIIGQQVAVLLNLEPRKIKGIESNGMILMAQDKEGKLTFVSPDEVIENGSEIN